MAQDYRAASNLTIVTSLDGDSDHLMTVLANGALRLIELQGAVINTSIITTNSTPANSSIETSGGKIFCDDDYLYVTTEANTVKRVALSSF